MKEITGPVAVAGDDITTEMICPARHRNSKRGEGAKHLFRDLPELSSKKLPEGAVLVAGGRFGLGDDPAGAARALLSGGVRCVIARSFPREFFRAAINAGLPLVTADLVGRCSAGQVVAVNLRKGSVQVGGDEIAVGKYVERVARIVENGGLLSAVRKELGRE